MCVVCVWILVLYISHIVFVMQLHTQEIRAVHTQEYLLSKIIRRKNYIFWSDINSYTIGTHLSSEDRQLAYRMVLKTNVIR